MSGWGTLAQVGGLLVQGVSGYQAAKANSKLISEQKKTEAELNAVQDNRERSQFLSQIREQTAQQAARGVQLDSPTAIYLGQTAAKEMSFQSQATRSGGQAVQNQLTAEQSALRARGISSLLRGGFGAAGAYLNRNPDAWPELLS
ncbi:MAG: hypothetical protein CML69_10865 [Rhodobacteraceae bacterium]|nr:hypothetical protein [Paracoccaceae bacterium]